MLPRTPPQLLMASWGPSKLSCWLAPDELLRWPRTRSTKRWCLGGSAGARQALSWSQELGLIRLPDQSWHRYVTTTIPGCSAVLLWLHRNLSIAGTHLPTERRAHYLPNSKGCSLQKQPVLGSHSFRTVNMHSRQSASLKTRFFLQTSIMSVLSTSVWKCWLQFLYPSVLLWYLSMAEQSGEQPQCWNPSHCYGAH